MAWGHDNLPAVDPVQIRELVARYRPRRWKVVQSRYRRDKGGSGLAEYDTRIIRVPLLIDVVDVHTFLHECGHVHLHHFEKELPHHVEEYEAEMYGFHVMWAERVPTPYRLMCDSRRVIEEAIASDMLKDIPIIPTAQGWVELGIVPKTGSIV